MPVGFADETAGRDADNRQSSRTQMQRLAQHIRAAPETALPVTVVQDNVWRLGTFVRRREHPPDRRADAQHVKISIRDESRASFFPLTAVHAKLPLLLAALRGHYRRVA